jgi:hypothetical protein
MNHFASWLGCLLIACVVTLAGCSSKKEEVAIAPAPVAAPANANPSGDSTSDDGSGDDGTMDDGSSGTDDGSDNSDDGSMAEDDGSSAGDDGSMAEDDGSMAENDGSMAENDGSMAEDDGSMSDDSGGSRPAVARAKPKNLREQSEQAFDDGYERAAYRLIQAHMLSSSADASELLSHYRWSPTRKQPQLGVRIAVGVELTSPSELKDFKPIGSLSGFFTKKKSVGRNRGEPVDDEPAPGESLVAFIPSNNKERLLQKYAGLMGDVLVDHVRAAHSEGKWSPIFQSLKGVASTAPQFSGGEEGVDDGSSGDDEGTGMVASSAAKAALDTKIEGAEAKHISLGPILTYIGRGSSTELLEQAKENEFDALIVYDVDVTVNTKLRLIYNACRGKLLNLDDGKSLAVSKLLKNTEAQKEIDKAGRSYVVTAMQPVLAKVDELVSVRDLPPLTAEILKNSKRIEKLVADEGRSKLDSITEIRLWREKLLIDDAELMSAYEAILGIEDGKVMATGTDAEKLVVVKKLLAMRVPSPSR